MHYLPWLQKAFEMQDMMQPMCVIMDCRMQRMI